MTTAMLTRTRFGGEPKTVRFINEGDRVRISFAYHPDAVQACRILRGRRYHPESKTWTIPTPSTAEKLEDIARIFGGFTVKVEGDPLPTMAHAEAMPTTATCALCGATEVPRHGRNWWQTNQHRAGEIYDRKRAYGGSVQDRCKGEDTFLRDLRNAKLARAGVGLRLETDSEVAERAGRSE